MDSHLSLCSQKILRDTLKYLENVNGKCIWFCDFGLDERLLSQIEKIWKLSVIFRLTPAWEYIISHKVKLFNADTYCRFELWVNCTKTPLMTLYLMSKYMFSIIESCPPILIKWLWNNDNTEFVWGISAQLLCHVGPIHVQMSTVSLWPKL